MGRARGRSGRRERELRVCAADGEAGREWPDHGECPYRVWHAAELHRVPWEAFVALGVLGFRPAGHGVFDRGTRLHGCARVSGWEADVWEAPVAQGSKLGKPAAAHPRG